MAVERDEVPVFEDFYRPLTSREETLSKLQVLRVRLMSDVTEADLFEALADTFATVAHEDYISGKIEVFGDREFPYGEWDTRDEVGIGDRQNVIGSWRDPKPRLERFFIDGITEGGDLDFDRESDGSVTVGFFREDQEEDEPLTPHELTDSEKETILDACLAGFSS